MPDFVEKGAKVLDTGNFGGIPEADMLVRHGDICRRERDMTVDLTTLHIDTGTTTVDHVVFTLVNCGTSRSGGQRLGWILASMLVQ